MRQTDFPPPSVGGRLLTRVAEICGVLSLAITIIAFVSSDARLVRPTAIVLAISLVAIGAAQLSCPSNRTQLAGAQGARRRMAKGFGRLCILGGATQLTSAILFSPLVAALAGIGIGLLLMCLGMRRPKSATGKRTNRRLPRARAGTLVLAIIATVLIISSGLAVAMIVPGGKESADTSPKQPGGKGSGTKGNAKASNSARRKPEPLPTYADLCPSLPNPLVIGHGLGELFERDDAIKAGCGTPAFRVPGTATWVSAGICSGERRSVAVSSPGHQPKIVYGAPAEFVWVAAQGGELVAVEAAAPAGGDVDLVETRSGTYGFARATRSATPGNEDAQSCSEVGGVAEPFARLAPPLLMLWTELVRDNATWYWPIFDHNNGRESVAFASTEEVDQGACDTDTSCYLEIDGEKRLLEGSAFITLADLREYMPPEEH